MNLGFQQSHIVVIAGIFGSLVGSFLNVCIFRLPRECMSIVKPRSRCPSCLAPIRWFDNIPILSYIILKGRCRYCRRYISVQYFLVELLTAAIFSYIAYTNLGDYNNRWAIAIIQAYLISAMIIATFVDLEFRILPDEITISGIVISLLVGVAVPSVYRSPVAIVSNANISGLITALIGIAAGGLLIYIIGILGRIAFGKDAMGFGDVKYLAMLGGFLGWQGVLLTFFLACFIGSIFGIILYIVTRDRYIAFGPYLSLGGAMVLLFSDEVYWLLELYMKMVGR
ncbi:MAG: hypothetical protein A2W23_09390 [Planctomycetes bacterium RBG_16_43_13]|nr:MAG: hypothetical protein A2W23_09390 [Planctomycetes bacterium RBG_16_43_13]